MSQRITRAQIYEIKLALKGHSSRENPWAYVRWLLDEVEAQDIEIAKLVHLVPAKDPPDSNTPGNPL